MEAICDEFLELSQRRSTMKQMSGVLVKGNLSQGRDRGSRDGGYESDLNSGSEDGAALSKKGSKAKKQRR